METFIVKSAETDARLVFSQRVGEDYSVEFQSQQLQVVHSVCGYTDPQGVARLFQALAAYSKPWKGQLHYQSLEQEFSISASCSSLGTVSLAVAFSRIGATQEWSATATIQIEFGQLSVLASNAKRFFGAVGR
ncbi:DUF6228 family protein [Hydrocarboniphaga effusa]|uniref:DUF6228 family protein n=1 Tax=Hydrocarboniphaga effusa TaxID=243629 RepID=UPI0012FB4167|nr:DUF6228 family protein [Hydrocarboniphaga effusa]MDZ4056093.1 DUF6228 family protein [Polynucleobacter sp.]